MYTFGRKAPYGVPVFTLDRIATCCKLLFYKLTTLQFRTPIVDFQGACYNVTNPRAVNA